ncbi:hypothetical protein [Pseudolysinimonas kribbensis]|uniref:hypothetical protein n=1 Tax=Pseudolysinimonas kribbensis TaxID=433641 RepID=UPI0031D4DA08
MEISIDPDWRTRFTRTAHAVTAPERNALARAARSGRLQRVVRGVYREPPPRPPSREDSHRQLVYAHDLRTEGRRVFVSESAAALWRLPVIGTPPPIVHVADGIGGGHSSRAIMRHATGVPRDVARIDGIRVTTLGETVVSLLRTRSLAGGLAAVDSALSGIAEAGGARIAREELAVLLDREGRGMGQARLLGALADGSAGSPGESVSRATMYRVGVPQPLLQFPMVDRNGEMFGDFCWPEHGLIGEFDGIGKYLREEWMDGQDAARVVIDEKLREDRIRALGWRVVRWGWAVARSPAALSTLLVDAGLPRPSAHVRTTWAPVHVPA